MRVAIALAFAVFLTTSVMAGSAEDEADIARLMDAYRDAYGVMDAHRVAAAFHEPYMLLAPSTVTVLAKREQVEEWQRSAMSRLKDRGYARGDWKNMRIKSFGNGIAIVSTIVIRYKTDGSVLETLAATYLLRKDPGGWKIAVITPHAPEATLSLQ